MSPRHVTGLLAACAIALAGCHESHPPADGARPDSGLRPRPDGGIAGECFPGEASLRGETAHGPLVEFPYATAIYRQTGEDCADGEVLFVLTQIPPSGRSVPEPSVGVRVYPLPGVDLFSATEPFVGEVDGELRDGDPFITVFRGATLRAEPVELGSGRVTLEIPPGGDVHGRIDAVYCRSSICL